MSRLFFIPKAVRIDSTGSPYAGAKANFYLTGTTTPTNTYQESALSTPHANPVVADSGGQFPAIYLDPDTTYRCIITESDDTQIDDIDPIWVPLDGTDISISDAGGYFSGTNVETVTQELGLDYMKKSRTETITADKTFSAANLKMADNIVERPEIKDFGITHTEPAATSTVTFDLSTGNSFATLLTENVTVTLSNPPATGTFGQCTIVITQDGGGGAYTVTWPASVKWPGGTAPVMSTGNDEIDKFTLSTEDGGTTWLGEFAQAYAVPP